MNAIIEALKSELKKTGSLELPFGTLTVHTPTPGRTIRFGRIARTGRKKKVHFKRKND